MSGVPGSDAEGGAAIGIDSRASIGTQLSAARKMRKLSIEKVAHELHLDTEIVRALENDEREKLPSLIFVQGYLKSYGRLVGLPVEDLIREYTRQAGEPPPLTVFRTNTKLPAVRLRSFRLIRNVIILLLAAILLWLAWPFVERIIDSQRESATGQLPGRLELPPASETVGNGS